MHSLPLFVRLADRPVMLLGEGDAADAKRRLLERAGARIVGEGGDALIAIVALDDDAEAQAAAARLKARGLLVNVVDRPALCDFTLPAIIDRDPVLVAIGTGGASAGLAKALRQRIEAMLPARLGSLADALFGVRAAMRKRWPDPSDRRRAIDAALAEGGALDPLADLAPDAVDRWLGQEMDVDTPDAIVDLPLASFDPDELTIRASRLLGRADILFHAPDVPAAILDRARADAVRVPSPQRPDRPAKGLALYLYRK